MSNGGGNSLSKRSHVVFLIAVLSLIAQDVAVFAAQAAASKTVIVAVDMSISSQGFKDQYREWTGKIIERLNEGDAIVLIKIMEASQGGGGTSVNESVTLSRIPADMQNNELIKEKVRRKREEELVAKRTQVAKKVEDYLKTQKSSAKRSEIMGAIAAAGKIFRQYGKQKSVLVVFSDMVEDSSLYNFEKLKLTEKKTREIIDNEKSRKAYPNLSGVKVLVVAPSTMNDARYTEITNFWLAYFRGAGAVFERDDYTNMLAAFNE